MTNAQQPIDQSITGPDNIELKKKSAIKFQYFLLQILNKYNN
jgi:hypothetical protein